MITVTTAAELRRQTGLLLRERGGPVGLVPTMGALHAGHVSLIQRCAEDCAVVVVSIFVNPTQFGEQSDLDNYPRTLDADSALCECNGVDIIFAPSPAEVYPGGFSTSVHVSGVSERWEGEFRPGHFDGVATVLAKLFGMLMPNRAYFGEKDFQQLCLIRQMTTDLNLPVEVIRCPTIREADGLAMSSRNVWLSPEERQAALRINAAMEWMAQYELGQIDAVTLAMSGRIGMEGDDGLIKVEYLAIVDPLTLETRIGAVQDGDRIITAVRCGETRLIDNMELRTASVVAGSPQNMQTTGTGS